MIKKRFLFVFLPLVLLGVLLIGVQNADAQTKTFNWEEWETVITLLENGDLRVEETQTLNFQGEPFTFGFRTIQTGTAGNNDGITDVGVREGNIIYEENYSSNPYTYTVIEEDEETTIRWYFEPSLGEQTYTFSYTVKGGTRVGTSDQGDGDQIFWTIVPDDHPARVDYTSATIHLPEGVEPQQYEDTLEYLAAGFINETESDLITTTVTENGRTIFYEYNSPLLTGNSLAARVQFPHGILPIQTPDWQRSQQISETMSLVILSISLLLCVGGPLLILLLWYLSGRDPELTVVVPDYITEPPDSLPPAVVGTLIDEKADMQDIVSTTIDLARRGYITMTEKKDSEYTFQRTDKSTEDLRPFEKQFVKDFFGRKQERELDDLKYKFANKLPNLRSMLYQELVDEQLVPSSPHKIRQSYGCLTVLVFVIAAGAFFIIPGIFGENVSTSICPALALAAAAIILAYVGRHMPKKTEKGVEAAAKWEAFKNYLKNIEDYQDLTESTEIFEQYLAYAVAFGLERSWIRKFSQVPATPIPRWYYPYPMYGGHYGGYGGSAGKPSGGGSVSAPSLEGMSRGMTGGLAAMSTGLTSMLTSTSSTLKSTRSSSGGSSGGFSGGFSGGGGFSSGGGGSAGFG